MGQSPTTPCCICELARTAQRGVEDLAQARAIENQCFVAGVNRSGTDGSGHHYAGDSLLVDMAGNILADAGGTGSPAVLRATWHKSELTAFRTSLPFLQDADRFGIR